MEPRISLVTLGVADGDRSSAFYEALALPRTDLESDEAAFFALEGAWLGLYRRDLLDEEVHADGGAGADRDGGFGGFTLAHTVESKERVDEVLDEAEAAGAE